MNANTSTSAIGPGPSSIIYPSWAILSALFWCCLIIVVGVAGNLITIISILHDSKLRASTTSKFMISLCVTDLLFCVVCLPITASRYAHSAWTLGDSLCVVFPLVFYWNVAASLFTMCAMTINRLILVVKTASYKLIYTSRNISLMIGACWLFPFCLLIGPLTQVWGRFGYVAKSFSCTILKDANGRSPKKLFFVIGFFIPCVVIAFSYIGIYITVGKSKQKMNHHYAHRTSSASQALNNTTTVSGSSPSRTSSCEEKAITRAMMVIYCVFLICYLPLLLANVLDDNDSMPCLQVLASALAWSASAVNPFVYCLLSSRYRAAVRALFHKSASDSREQETPNSRNLIRFRRNLRNQGSSGHERSESIHLNYVNQQIRGHPNNNKTRNNAQSQIV